MFTSYSPPTPLPRSFVVRCACGVCAQYVKNQRKLTCMRRIKRTMYCMCVSVYSWFVLFLQQTKRRRPILFVTIFMLQTLWIGWLYVFMCRYTKQNCKFAYFCTVLVSRSRAPHVHILRLHSYVLILCALVCFLGRLLLSSFSCFV